MDEWLEFMEGVIIPFLISNGMVINGSFRGVEDDAAYIWIRRFDDEQHRKALYEKVYESDVWKNEISPKVGDLIDRDATVVKQIVPTKQSLIQ
jgi:hypothetical protein